MAAKKVVKCKYCGVEFDRNAEPFVEVGGRRYAHKECAEKYEASIPQEEKDYKVLEEYIKKVLKITTLNVRIRKQIKEFRETYDYTYSGMYKTLYWWYDIKKHSIDLANNGIGIIPYIYEDALKYYYNIWLAQSLNAGMNEYHPQIKEIEIGSPRAITSSTKRLFKIED